jgi:ADP-ribosylglycohydrolase
MVAAWQRAHSGLERGERLPRHLRDADMAGWNTVATAHAIAHLYADDLETAIGLAAGSGKDTDTVASMTGAMLGAVHGVTALPARWLRGLQQRTTIESAAEQLLAQL